MSKQPINASDVQAEVWYPNTGREIHGRALCDVGGKAKVGVGILELPPGSDTRPAHYHTLEEEHLFVIEGRATLHLGIQTFLLRAGSYVCFPASQPLFHYIHNDSQDAFRYLMIGERIESDVVVYAD